MLLLSTGAQINSSYLSRGHVKGYASLGPKECPNGGCASTGPRVPRPNSDENFCRPYRCSYATRSQSERESCCVQTLTTTHASQWARLPRRTCWRRATTTLISSPYPWRCCEPRAPMGSARPSSTSPPSRARAGSTTSTPPGGTAWVFLKLFAVENEFCIGLLKAFLKLSIDNPHYIAQLWANFLCKSPQHGLPHSACRTD